MVDRVAQYDRAQLTGGAIADGTYVLTEVTHYVEPSHTDGTRRPYGRDTVVVQGGTIEDVVEDPSGATARFVATLAANGSRLAMTTGCTWSSTPMSPLPASGDWFELVHDDNSFGATPTTITIWTTRGNHEQIVRVFTKQ